MGSKESINQKLNTLKETILAITSTIIQKQKKKSQQKVQSKHLTLTLTSIFHFLRKLRIIKEYNSQSLRVFTGKNSLGLVTRSQRDIWVV